MPSWPATTPCGRRPSRRAETLAAESCREETLPRVGILSPERVRATPLLRYTGLGSMDWNDTIQVARPAVAGFGARGVSWSLADFFGKVSYRDLPERPGPVKPRSPGGLGSGNIPESTLAGPERVMAMSRHVRFGVLARSPKERRSCRVKMGSFRISGVDSCRSSRQRLAEMRPDPIRAADPRENSALQRQDRAEIAFGATGCFPKMK